MLTQMIAQVTAVARPGVRDLLSTPPERRPVQWNPAKGGVGSANIQGLKEERIKTISDMMLLFDRAKPATISGGHLVCAISLRRKPPADPGVQ